MKGIYLVGEAPPRSRMKDSLESLPFSGSSGRRLSELIGQDVTKAFHTINVFDEWPGASHKGSLFPLKEARARVIHHMRTQFETGDQLILVGGRVAKAFKATHLPLFHWRWMRFTYNDSNSTVGGLRQLKIARIPHPSGVSTWWNDPSNPPQVKAFLVECLSGD